jgi:hypothetical protein
MDSHLLAVESRSQVNHTNAVRSPACTVKDRCKPLISLQQAFMWLRAIPLCVTCAEEGVRLWVARHDEQQAT